MGDGPLIQSLVQAKAMLRDCYWWRRLADELNPWDEATAAAHIHFDGLPPASTGPNHSRQELINLRPFALVWADPSGGLAIDLETAGGCCSRPSGRVIVQVEMNVPSALASDPDALAEHLNRRYGQLMQTRDAAQPGLVELSHQAGYLAITRLELLGYVRTDTKAAVQLGDAVVGELVLTWGLDA